MRQKEKGSEGVNWVTGVKVGDGGSVWQKGDEDG